MKNIVFAGIFGGVVADALGVPYEFQSLEEMQENPAETMTGYGTYNQPPGSWSDDSSLTLALMDSLINGVDYVAIMKKFADWYNNAEYTPRNEVFDCGITTSEAISRFVNKRCNPVECGGKNERDNGNGSLMRIMPILLYVNAKNVSTQKQIELINDISSLTHSHKISKASCNIYNFIVQEVLYDNTNDFKKIINKGIDNARFYYENEEYECFYNIFNDLFSLPEINIGSEGYVVDTLEVALYCCYHTNSYRNAVLKAVNFGGDTDTNAMITGGLAALYYGYESIPKNWLKTIIKFKYIQSLCVKFADSLDK